MPADALVTLGAKASAAMVLTPQSRNIPSPTSEESRNEWYKMQICISSKEIEREKKG